MASQVKFLDSFTYIRFRHSPCPRLAHGALRQSRKGKSYEDFADPFTTGRFEFFTAPDGAGKGRFAKQEPVAQPVRTRHAESSRAQARELCQV